MIKNTVLFLSVLLVAASLSGCTTTHDPAIDATETMAMPQLAKAEGLLKKGDYTGAMLECVDLAQENPDLAGLESLQRRIMAKLEDQRASRAKARESVTVKRMATDLTRQKDLPDTYGLRRNIIGQFGSLRTPGNAMQKALQKKVTVHLDNVDLTNFILTMGASEKVNIVADNLASDRTVTIHADQVPLSEILDYVSRNLGITFFIGENIIWATPQTQDQPGIPMATRMYRLRKGIDGKLEAGTGTQQAESAEENVPIELAILRFVDQPDGADLLFDKKSHALIVKNTVENLAKVEDIIETMDVCPPQILIEARFVSTGVTDLRELGIDWVLNSPYVVMESEGRSRTQINQGGTVGFTQPANAAQGLNVSYEGILTDPMFKATIHALDKTGRARTLSVPKVTTINNRVASIRVGEDFRYYDEYDIQSTPSQVTGNAGNTVYSSILVPVGSPKLEELGIELKVRPSVGSDMSSITLQLLPEISEFVRYETYQVGTGNNNNNQNANDTTSTSTSTNNGMSTVKLPIFRRSKIETEVIVQSGETVVMGGLITSTEGKRKEKVPFLSSIPLLGLLFQNDVTDTEQKNLLIFVTATIISERGENLVPLALPKTSGKTTATAANSGK
jgi:type II secretory pathway component GspD/PulD (secretin)